MPLHPPTDSDGNIIAHDDPAIRPETFVIRYINPVAHVFFDENTKQRRIASAAFGPSSRDPDFGMSVDIGQLLTETGLPENARVPSDRGAVRLNVGRVRELKLRVGSDPIAAGRLPANPFHGQVWGVKSGMRAKLHDVVVDWVSPLQGVSIR